MINARRAEYDRDIDSTTHQSLLVSARAELAELPAAADAKVAGGIVSAIRS